MIARRHVLSAVCACTALSVVRAHAADVSAKSFVEAIYAAYIGKDSKGVSLDSNAAVRRYFEPKLAALIIKDRREARGEVGKLGSDPFIDAQDWEIDSVDVAVRDAVHAGTSFDLEHRILRADGAERSVHTHGAVICDAADQQYSPVIAASPISRGIATELCAAF